MPTIFLISCYAQTTHYGKVVPEICQSSLKIFGHIMETIKCLHYCISLSNITGTLLHFNSNHYCHCTKINFAHLRIRNVVEPNLAKVIFFQRVFPISVYWYWSNSDLCFDIFDVIIEPQRCALFYVNFSKTHFPFVS